MLRSYLAVALRALKRQPGYTAINVLGLAVGMACCLLIGLYVQHEWSYDRAWPGADRLYRVVEGPPDDLGAITGGAMVHALRADYGEQIEVAGRFTCAAPVLRLDDPATGAVSSFEEDGFCYADPSALDVFGLTLTRGNPATALDGADKVVLTASRAAKYFGEANPVGQTLRLGGVRGDERTLTVTGVLPDLPATTHLDFTLLASFDTFKATWNFPLDRPIGSFSWPAAYTYVKLAPEADAAALNAALPTFITRHREPDVAKNNPPALEAVTSIHLYSDAAGSMSPGSSAQTVAVFAAIAAFVLVIAGVNFMNLATARASERAREVGVRKSLGAQRGQLVGQFLGESVLLSLVALVLALGIAWLALPPFADLAARELAFDWASPALWGLLGSTLLVTGLGAGSYPALVLAGFDPARVLKSAGGRTGTGGSDRLRKGLVVFQFAVSVALIAATAIAYQQFSFMREANLGFDQDQVVRIEAAGDYATLRQEMARLPEVRSVTGTTATPGLSVSAAFRYETDRVPDSGDGDRLPHVRVDYGFFEMMGVGVLAGRVFDPARPADLGVAQPPAADHFGWYLRERALVINASAARKMGWTPDEAVGQYLRLFSEEAGTFYSDIGGTVIGVVDDYHTRSLRDPMRPVTYDLVKTEIDGRTGYAARVLLAKVKPGGAASTLAALEGVWTRLNPETPFQASFLDDDLDNLYRSERRTGQIMALFAGLAILVACLGLLGLATYTARQRTKEIGIRKTMGASTPQIVGLLARDFVTLVAVAVVLAAPPAYLGMEQWLSAFAYRIDVGPVPFLVTGGGVLLAALATVSTQALRAARLDPVKALRTD